MKITSLRFRILHVIKAPACVLLTMLLASCAASSALKQVPIPSTGPAEHPLYSYHHLQYLSGDFRSGVNTQPPPEILDAGTSSVFNQYPDHLEAASKVWVYALMASNAYRDQGNTYTIPDWKVTSRWESPSGLGLEQWAHTNASGQLDEIAVAFEGTNFDSWPDWRANFSLIEPQQNKEAVAYIKNLLDARPAGVRVVTTGHSLGGALALNMSVRFPGVDFRGFDSSPRGFFKITRSEYDKASSRIFVYEKGEILTAVRVLWFNRLRKFDDKYWYNFMYFNPNALPAVANHNMYLISRGLLMLAIKQGDATAGRTFTANFKDKDLQEVYKVGKQTDQHVETASESQHDIQCCDWIFKTYP